MLISIDDCLILFLKSGNNTWESSKEEKMEKIKLYCINKIILGRKVSLNNRWCWFKWNIGCYSFIRAETEKGLSRKHVIEGLRASLERLQLDYVDIVFANKPDTSVPMEGNLIKRQIFFFFYSSHLNKFDF